MHADSGTRDRLSNRTLLLKHIYHNDGIEISEFEVLFCIIYRNLQYLIDFFNYFHKF